MPKLMYGFLSF